MIILPHSQSGLIFFLLEELKKNLTASDLAYSTVFTGCHCPDVIGIYKLLVVYAWALRKDK